MSELEGFRHQEFLPDILSAMSNNNMGRIATLDKKDLISKSIIGLKILIVIHYYTKVPKFTKYN